MTLDTLRSVTINQCYPESCAMLSKRIKNMDEILEKIAADELDIPTLETRRSDSLDFYDRSVWRLKTALEKAFLAGVLSMKKINWDKAPKFAKSAGWTVIGGKICWSSEENPKGFIVYVKRPNV